MRNAAPDTPAPAAPARGLIVAPSWIGDAVMAQPLFARIKAADPDLQLDALAPSWVAPVLRRIPEISQVLDNPFGHGALQLGARYRLGRELAASRYRRAWVLPNSLKSALLPWFAGIPERVGFTGESRYGLLNCRHRLDKVALPLMVERFAQLAQMPGSPLSRPVAYPRLNSSAHQQAAVLAELQLQGALRPIVLCPGAEYGPAKRWPAAHFATLARVLMERGHAVWLLGSPKDRPVGDAIVALAPGPCLNLCGSTRLDQAIDLIAQAELVVCNDSGLMHVAAALGRPLVALYGSSSPGFTPPLSDKATLLRLGLECSPCFKRECPLGHLDCLEKLPPAKVLDACLARLEP